MVGGGIDLLSGTSSFGNSLLEELLGRRFKRVVGSSASSSAPLLAEASVVTIDLVLGRLLGGFAASTEAVAFLCLLAVILNETESAASSPEASREEG